jgi:hypothetical protein
MNYRHLTAILVLIFCIGSVHAQSGRRQVKAPPAAPVPTPTPEPTPTPKKAETKDQLLFFVGADRHDSYQNLPFAYYDAAVFGCANRLRSLSSAAVDTSERSLGRGDAIKKAKSEPPTFVVYLNLVLDSMARSYDDLVLEFVVFAPRTAKVVTNGRSYLVGQRAGPIVLGPNGRTATSSIYRQELIKRAGEDAGDRILKALHLDVDGRKTP